MIRNCNITCRICLKLGEVPLFNENESLNYGLKIMKISSIQISKGDGLPNVICSECIYLLDMAVTLKMKIEATDLELQQYLKDLELPLMAIKNDNEEKFIIEEDVTISDDLKYNVTNADLNVVDIKNTSQDKLLIAVETSTGTNQRLNMTVSQESIESSERVQKKANKTVGRKPRSNKKSNIELKETSIYRGQTSKKIIFKKQITTKSKRKNSMTRSRKHMCDTCGKTFFYKSNLSDHVRIHSGDKPFVCNVCGQRFSQAGHLMIHMRTHSGVKPYQCEHCWRCFTVSHALKKHLRIHTGERPYECSVCKKTFVTSYHLSNHFKRHTGEKNFKCDWPGCTLCFVNISEMKRHRTKHDKNQESNQKLLPVPTMNLNSSQTEEVHYSHVTF